VNACTDITGFGLLGHLLLMLRASDVGARILVEEVPLVSRALEYTREGLVPGGTKKNFEYVQPYTKILNKIDPDLHTLLCDAQTSGGLLMAVAKEKAGDLVDLLHHHELLSARLIGHVIATKAPSIELQ
jgi:selenide,water dikinase